MPVKTFEELLQKYRDISFSERDKGYRFERLMQSFLKPYPLYEGKFTSIWLWNEFRGNQRTSGELSRKEGGENFGSGSRTPVTITILAKKGSKGRG